jgi:hypothetical protein
MGKFNFNINGKTYVFSGQGSPEFKYGKEEVLSGQKTDIAFGQPWYQKGYKAIPFLSARVNRLYTKINQQRTGNGG